MVTSEGNKDVAPAEMPPNKGETHTVKMDMHEFDGEREKMDADVQANKGETQYANVDVGSENLEIQPTDIVMLPETVKMQPADDDMQAENVENQPGDVVMQAENVDAQLTDSEIQPSNKEMKAVNSQTQQNNGVAKPADAQADNGEKQPTGAQSNNGEKQATDAQPNNGERQSANAQPNNDETQPIDVQPDHSCYKETQPTNEQPENEGTRSGDVQPKYGIKQEADTEPNRGESQTTHVQPKSDETGLANVLLNSVLVTQPVEICPNNGETPPTGAQLSNEAIQSGDAKTQMKNAKEEPVDANIEMEPSGAGIQSEDGKTKAVDAETCPGNGDTRPANAEMHLGDGEPQPTDADVHQVDGQYQPANLEIQPFDTEMQPNEESNQHDMQPNSGGLQPFDLKMQQSDIEMQSINEDMQLNKNELQPVDTDLHPEVGELQPMDAHIQPDSGEIQTFGAEQLNNGEMPSSYAEYQANNGGMQPYNPETHPHNVQMQPYHPEMQLHEGKIQRFDAEIQTQYGQLQPYMPELQTQDEQIQPYNSETQPQDGEIQQYNPEIQPNKRRKKKSMVWEHFTIENVSPGCRRASCNRCKQSFAYSTGSKVAGTSHLKRHIVKGTCAAFVQNQDYPYTPSPRMRGSVSGTKRRYRSSTTPYVQFDHDRCRQEIAKMIIKHEYPLDMVEHPGFESFVQSIQPQFDVGSFSTVQGDCIATYLTEKQNVMRLVEGTLGRVCLTLDLWTSNQNVGYVVITGHFIDNEWKSNRRVLNVVMEPYPESDAVLSHALSVCLSEWSLEGKIFSITSSQHKNEAGRENLRAHLAVKNPHVLNGQLLIENCIGRTLGCLVTDLLGAGQDIVKKVRDSVKYVKASDSHEEKFFELKRQLQVPSEKSLILDDQTKWNTTFEMLLAASELKEVFSCLDTTDPDYKKAPSMEVWKQVETLCTYLKLLYDAANVLTNTPNVTAITCFHELWKIYSELGRVVSSEDPFVVHLTRSMHEKLIKYWKNCSLILAMAVVMDPRFRMKLVEFSFTKLYSEEAPTYVRIVDEGIRELFDEYVALPLPLTPTYAEEGHAGNDMRTDEHGEMLLSDHGLSDFDMYIMETTGQQMKSELDQYLEESLLPRVQEIDVLSWWKLNKLKYPNLSKMARDILTTPICTVTSETIFDTTPNRMDAYRSTLRPVTVEALICAKDWLQYAPSEESSTPLKMEF